MTDSGQVTIAPQGWVTFRLYNEKDLDETLDALLRERDDSLRWRGKLRQPICEAPWGPIHAGSFPL